MSEAREITIDSIDRSTVTVNTISPHGLKSGDVLTLYDAPLDPPRLVDYEIRASWWAQWIGVGWLQDLVATYFARKVRRKHKRYIESHRMRKSVAAELAQKS